MTAQFKDTIDAVLKARRARYGSFSDQAAVSVKLKEILQSLPNWKNLKPDQREALEMFCVKMSRIIVGDPDYLDNWVDIEGYAKLVVDRLRYTKDISTLENKVESASEIKE